MSAIYYIDRDREGQPRDIIGPFASLEKARENLSVGEEEISVNAYDGVVADLEQRHHGANARLVEAWAAECESDADCIYEVTV